MFLDSVALSLHGFYSGLEGLFLQVARHLDEKVPDGDGWHAKLIAQMHDETELRPAVIADSDIEFLDELRRFLAPWESEFRGRRKADGTWEYLRQFEDDPWVRLYQVSWAELYAGWNECLMRARGECVF